MKHASPRRAGDRVGASNRSVGAPRPSKASPAEDPLAGFIGAGSHDGPAAAAGCRSLDRQNFRPVRLSLWNELGSVGAVRAEYRVHTGAVSRSRWWRPSSSPRAGLARLPQEEPPAGVLRPLGQEIVGGAEHRREQQVEVGEHRRPLGRRRDRAPPTSTPALMSPPSTTTRPWNHSSSSPAARTGWR